MGVLLTQLPMPFSVAFVVLCHFQVFLCIARRPPCTVRVAYFGGTYDAPCKRAIIFVFVSCHQVPVSHSIHITITFQALYLCRELPAFVCVHSVVRLWKYVGIVTVKGPCLCSNDAAHC